MDFLSDTSINLLQKGLDAVWLRESIISNNIANKDTPGYKSKYVSFETELKKILSENDLSDSTLKEKIENIEPEVLENRTTSANEDGNNVDVVSEEVEMARAQIQYDYLVRSLNSQINSLKYAINGGK